jgi:hypothetical protein
MMRYFSIGASAVMVAFAVPSALSSVAFASPSATTTPLKMDRSRKIERAATALVSS